MQARSNIIKHPSGVKIKTPLLVPSFSSRGFEFLGRDVPEVHEDLLTYKEWLTECLLVSAYDLHYNHIPKANEFAPATPISFIDSGGYESYHSNDFLGASKYMHPNKDWSSQLLKDTLIKWPQEYPAIIVSFDGDPVSGDPMSWENQLVEAQKLFDLYPEQLHNFLIKPEPDNRVVPLEKIVNNIGALNGFNIIGMTEKELGPSILARMVNISKIRTALDRSGNFVPIHIFGSLDPITSTLYFFAGAEIFDGLTWLKYAYHENIAVYSPNCGVIRHGIEKDDDVIEKELGKENIYYLINLKYAMLDFLKSGNFNEFEKLGIGMGKLFEKYYSQFEEQLKK
jgi:hypothetical protein